MIDAFKTPVVYLPQHARNAKDGTPPSPGMRFEDLPKRCVARSSAVRKPTPPAVMGSSRPRRHKETGYHD